MPLEQLSELRVRYAETDQMGVVYHANYLVWCEIGRTDFIRALGRPYAQLETEGVRLAVADVSMRFHAGATYDDPIRVRTRLTAVRSRALTFAYQIEHAEGGRLLVTASTMLMATGADGRSRALPEELRTLLAGALWEEP
ncbi:MAG: acyl-CoA thioesterase [Gemmatimonadetes bacterium]|nr:acyl-CoA thioesterase [Gemmatimonadota bacterium]